MRYEKNKPNGKFLEETTQIKVQVKIVGVKKYEEF